MPRPFVSVLIDTYNHERFIEQAIVSALEQDFPASDREIIVVDDGSTDRTPELLRKFEPDVRVLRKTNGGQASAFNIGIPGCKGQIIAFLDGDDWWAPSKLKAVTEALTGDSAIGLVGHGITEVYSDGRQHTELLREVPRFRLESKEGARTFRLRKSFLGTSRMTYRSEILRRIGAVPEALVFEADEYLFTLAGLFADVLIVRESYTYYRLHQGNAFQIADGCPEFLRRKHRVLSALLESLSSRFREERLAEEIAAIVLESVKTEADLLRLRADGGFPWETVDAELRNFRIHHGNASPGRWILKCISLAPACLLPSRLYYSLRQKLDSNSAYAKIRAKWLPFPQPEHVDRYRTARL